jgi:hypothetical protein
VALGAVLLSTACGTTRASTRSDAAGTTAQRPPATTQAPEATPQQRREQAIAQADGSLSGQVQQVAPGSLTLTPYAPTPTSPVIALGEDVPVFQGAGTVSPRALLPGTDVAVYFKGSGADRRAVAVEVLDAQAAKDAREAAEQQSARLDRRAERETVVAPEYLQRADGSQPGKVREVAGGFLVLDPYQRAAGDARLQLSPSVPVFQGEGRLGTQALRPGTDVRVFYKQGTREQPSQVVAVEILDPQNAQEIRREIEEAPKGR